MAHGRDFGGLLKRYRLGAGMTQELLAGQAGVSVRALRDLERGAIRTPRKDTIALLAGALNLSLEERAALDETVVRARPQPSTPDDDAANLATPTAPAAVRSHTLPAPLTTFVGRECELNQVCEILSRDDVRLLTITGPGGVGKTRLALRAATDLLPLFPDGVFFVPLAALDDGALVAATVAHALGLDQTGEAIGAASVVERLRDRKALLILDNFEHLAPAAPLVADLLAACHRLTALVTSRALLRPQGEHRFALRPLPLPLPDAGAQRDVEQLIQYDAVRLFVARARTLQPGLAMTPETVRAIAEICRRVDGLPLAIELAAARASLLQPRALLARLERRLPLLTAGACDLPERQRTLRATIAWSYDLLDADARTLFRRLAVFAGGCTLEAVEQVCLVPAEERVDRDERVDVLDMMTYLANQSLIRIQDTGRPAPRVTLLETIREYALERLADNREEGDARRRHALYYRELAETAEPELAGPRVLEWLDLLHEDHDNLRAALRWAQETGDSDTGLRLAGALWHFWYMRGYVVEGQRWLDTLLARTDRRRTASAIVAKALNGASRLAAARGDYTRATALLEDCRAVREESGDTKGVSDTLHNLGIVVMEQRDYDRAATLFQEDLSIQRSLGNQRAIAAVLGNLGELARLRGDDGVQATVWAEESLAIYRALGDRRGSVIALQTLGSAAALAGDHTRTCALYDECLGLWEEMGDRRGQAECLEALAHVEALEGRPRRAAQLFDAAAALRDETGIPMSPADRAVYDPCIVAVRARLEGDTRAEPWAAKGASMERATG